MWSIETEKKKYLNQYAPCVEAVKEIERSLADLEKEIREFLRCIDIELLKSYFESLKQVRKMLFQARYRKWFLYLDIYKKIEKMEDETERRVLRLKYLEGYSWEQVAEEIGYSVRQIHNIHKKSLENLKI